MKMIFFYGSFKSQSRLSKDTLSYLYLNTFKYIEFSRDETSYACTTIMRRFLKLDAVDGKTVSEHVEIDSILPVTCLGLSNFKTMKFLVTVWKERLSLTNGNTNIEHTCSLSDKKNTLTVERTKLSDQALKAVRRTKEYARHCDRAHNVPTSSKEITLTIKDLHRTFTEW